MLVKVTENVKIFDYAVIQLTHGKVALIDWADLEELSKYTWHARKSFSRYYAMRKVVQNGHEFWIRMHRQLTNCPRGYIVHHVNRRTLDNRRDNLEVMTQQQHKHLHINKLPRLIKHAKTSK